MIPDYYSMDFIWQNRKDYLLIMWSQTHFWSFQPSIFAILPIFTNEPIYLAKRRNLGTRFLNFSALHQFWLARKEIRWISLFLWRMLQLQSRCLEVFVFDFRYLHMLYLQTTCLFLNFYSPRGLSLCSMMNPIFTLHSYRLDLVGN